MPIKKGILRLCAVFLNMPSADCQQMTAPYRLSMKQAKDHAPSARIKNGSPAMG
ncbi:MAG: hypothetical protein ABC596_07630 [Candidatus Methanosuratincola petrocarbonis]